MLLSVQLQPTPPPPLILSIDALGKLNINSSFLPCQVGQRVKPKRSWQLTFIHLHPIKRNSQLLMSCYSLQREKVWKMEKIPKCHKNVRFGSDLPTHGSFPSKRLFISLPTQPSKRKQPDFQKRLAAGTPFEILSPTCSDLRARGAAVPSALQGQGGGNLTTSLRCLNQAWTCLQAWPWPPWLVVTSDHPLQFFQGGLHSNSALLWSCYVMGKGSVATQSCFYRGKAGAKMLWQQKEEELVFPEKIKGAERRGLTFGKRRTGLISLPLDCNS